VLMCRSAGTQEGHLSWCLRAAAMATVLNWSAHGAGAGSEARAKTKKMTLASITKEGNWGEGEAHFREKLLNLGGGKRTPKSNTLNSLMMPYQVCKIMSFASRLGSDDTFAQWLAKQQPLVEELVLSLDERMSPTDAVPQEYGDAARTPLEVDAADSPLHLKVRRK